MHDGPTGFSTTNGNDSGGNIQTGSDYLNSILQIEKDGHCVGVVHGHNHVGSFVDYVREHDFVEFPIVNPGSLNLGEYGYMHLSQSISHHSLQ